MTKMTLGEVIERVNDLDVEHTIYAAFDDVPSKASPAVVTVEPEDGSVPVEAVGMRYLLEVNLAREALEVWRSWRAGRLPSIDEAVDAIIYYALNDAFLPLS